MLRLNLLKERNVYLKKFNKDLLLKSVPKKIEINCANEAK